MYYFTYFLRKSHADPTSQLNHTLTLSPFFTQKQLNTDGTLITARLKPKREINKAAVRMSSLELMFCSFVFASHALICQLSLACNILVRECVAEMHHSPQSCIHPVPSDLLHMTDEWGKGDLKKTPYREP